MKKELHFKLFVKNVSNMNTNHLKITELITTKTLLPNLMNLPPNIILNTVLLVLLSVILVIILPIVMEIWLLLVFLENALMDTENPPIKKSLHVFNVKEKEFPDVNQLKMDPKFLLNVKLKVLLDKTMII